ncbi:hypothetical protein [Flexithrix dorotheae]|uniref:hypothetical protein n=1 Tax=Flexithrix dorotheae TaxID=70993 RepID=UPI0012FB8219|nr:hypothetical protein [Flexithrix dorotheae]
MMPDHYQIPQKVRKNGYDYQLIMKDDFKAIYQQNLEGKQIGYEIILLEKNGAKSKSPKSFPSNEDFGKTAWAIKSEERARQFYQSLLPANTNQLEIQF